MVDYHLQEKDVNKEVTEVHLVLISQSSCEHWDKLHPFLEMERIEASDVNQSRGSPEGKRIAFFSKWKDQKGSEATYKKLICSLLITKSVDDAEKICRLIQPTLQQTTAERIPEPNSNVSDPAMSIGIVTTLLESACVRSLC